MALIYKNGAAPPELLFIDTDAWDQDNGSVIEMMYF